jgi:integrase
MPTKTRAPRNSAAIYAQDGYLRINLTCGGRRLRKALGLADTPQNRAIANVIATEMNRDLAWGEFRGVDAYLRKPPKHSTIQELFQHWMEYLGQCNTPSGTLASRHRPLLTNLEDWGKDITTTEQAAKFLGKMAGRQRPKTTNTYLSLLKAWGKWAISQGYRDSNPFEPIRPFPGAKVAAEGEPFTPDEVARILGTMAEGKFAHYVDFTYFLLATGVRPGEAIALRWEQVDLTAGTVRIAETLTRPKDGKRLRKGPKTGDKGIRTLPLTDELKTVLRGRRPPYCHPNHLVFPGPKGQPIHDNNFRNRAWKVTLEEAGVAYRKPYFCRITFASMAIAQGATLPNTAKLLGHADLQMVQQTYGRAMGEINLPTLPLTRSKPAPTEKVVQLRAAGSS